MRTDDNRFMMMEDDKKKSDYVLVEMGIFILSMALVIVAI